jgi:hypothetical protein
MSLYTSDRVAKLVRTRTGLVIGGAYVPPPTPPSQDAERIQAILLHRDQVRRTGRVADAVIVALGALLLIVLAAHMAAMYF